MQGRVFTAVLVAVTLPAAAFASGAPRDDAGARTTTSAVATPAAAVGLRVAAPPRSALGRGAALRVTVRPPSTRSHRLVVGLEPRRGRTLKARTAFVRVRRAGRARTLRLTLSKAARRRLAGCTEQRITVRLVRRGGRTVTRAVVRFAARDCGSTFGGGRTSAKSTSPAPGGAEGGPGGATGGSGPGAGGSGQGGGGSGTPRDPDPVAPGFDTATFDRCDALDPAVCMQPFPSNHLTVPADTPTGRKVNFTNDSMPKNREGKPIESSDYDYADGFSPGNMLITRVPGLDTPEAFRASALPPVDAPQRSLAAGSPVVVVNADTLERHPVWAEIDSNPEDPADRNLIIRPARNFEEGARYVVALRDLKRADGGAIGAARPFEVYRDRIITTDAKVEGRRPAMESLLGTLGRAGVARDERLFLAWDFSVASAQSTTSRMLSIRDRAFAGLGDTVLDDREVQGTSPVFTINPDLPDSSPDPPNPGLPVDPPGPSGTDGIRDFPTGPIARRVRGRITVPCFLSTPGCQPAGSRFVLTGDGTQPVRAPGNTAVYDFTCQIPRRALDPAEPKLRGGLYGHGLFGSQGEIDSGQLRDFSQEHGFLFCAVDWNGMSFKDVPNVATILQDLSNFPTLTDHVQQGFLGFLFLGRAMIHPQGLSANPAFKIDGREVLDRSALYYDGNSQGGIYGGSLTAIAPDFERATLGVPGMNYSLLLRRSVDFDAYAEGDFGTDTEAGLYDAYPSELERPLVLSLIQLLWDRSDPNGYVHHMTDRPLPNTPTHEVLLHPAFGDHQVADVAAEVQARTLGLAMHKPGLEPGRARFAGRPYPDEPEPEPFFGLPSFGAPGYSATGSGIVFWDTGPFTGSAAQAEGCDRDAGEQGTPSPPAGNVPPRAGCDPHGAPRSDPDARRQKSEFLKPDGRIVDVCGGPCFAGPYAGAAP